MPAKDPAAELLIPVKKYRPAEGSFSWPARPVLASPTAADALPLGQLAADLECFATARPRIVRDVATPAAVRIRRDRRIAGHEAYRISVTPQGVELRAAADAGAYYAVQTLRELVKLHGRRLPRCVIDDQPDFARRGLYLDCSRDKVPTLATIKELVTRLAHWKVNELQLYIENVFTFAAHPAIGRGYSPFTPAEILELQDFCRPHHVRLVGSLASFGHMERVLQLPQYVHLGEMAGYRGWPGGTTLCPIDGGSIKLMGELYEEFVPLFEAVDFNLCGDEPWELGKGRSKRRAEKVGVGQVYVDFLLKLHDLCQKHGKRTNAWADIVLEHPELLGQLPKDIVMLNWGYEADGPAIPRTCEIADAGLPLVVCPGTNGWRTHGTKIDTAVGNVANFAAAGRKHHAEGLLNTDWGDGGHRNFLGASLHGFAHGAAHAWHGRGVDDEAFTERFCISVFGEAGRRLAGPLWTLGTAYRTSGYTARYGSPLSWAIVEPLLPKNPDDQSCCRINMATESGLRKVLDQLDDPSIWPDATPSLPQFERLALQELRTAAWMDCLAARRALAAFALRAGKSVPPATLRSLAGETDRVAAAFERLWLARNKPSRLRDNMRQFRQAAAESRKLAGRRPQR